MRRALIAAAALLCMAAPALAQSTYPTQYGGRVAGVVVLQCDTNGANCQPNGSSGAVANQIQGDVAHGAIDSGNPVKVGGIVVSGTPSVSAGTRSNAYLTVSGHLLVAPYVTLAGVDGLSNARLGQTYSTDGAGVYPASMNFVFNGTSWDRVRGDANGTAVTPGISSTYWSYTSGTSPILSNTTTAVTIKTASGAGVRNFIDSCQIATTAFGAAVPLAIRDGAGGTVIWANVVPTAGWLSPVNLIFQMPLRGSANTLLEIVTTTANTSGTVTANCQGHTGS